MKSTSELEDELLIQREALVEAREALVEAREALVELKKNELERSKFDVHSAIVNGIEARFMQQENERLREETPYINANHKGN